MSASLALELTAVCPRACLYCYNRWNAPGAAEPAGPDRLEEVVDAALAGGRFVRADLTGGEPMARPGFFDVLDRVRGHGVRAALVTDGGLVGPEEARALRAREVTRVQVTVLSTDRERHARLKGADGLDATLGAIALLRREGVPVSVAFLCTRANHGDLDDVVRLCRALGVRELAFSRLCTVGRALAHAGELWPEPWMVAEALARLPDLGRRYRVRVHNAVAVPHCVSSGGGGCSLVAGTPNLTIEPSGDVRPCSVAPWRVGNLLSDGWAGVSARLGGLLRAVREALPEECRACERVAACGGGCRASAAGASGETVGLDPLARPPLERARGNGQPRCGVYGLR